MENILNIGSIGPSGAPTWLFLMVWKYNLSGYCPWNKKVGKRKVKLTSAWRV
jgi:hypothetical protein